MESTREACEAIDEITGAVCNKPYETDELSHIIHRCTEDGIEFVWKATPALAEGELEIITHW